MANQMIVVYRHPSLTGKALCCEKSFFPALDVFCSLLVKYGLTCVITSSWRFDTNVSGAIVTPAVMSNHLVGHGFDCNFIDNTGRYWNSKALKNPTGDMKKFLDEVDATPELRWGGAFNVPDSVHIDDGLNIMDPLRWGSLFNEIHLAMAA